MAAHGENAEFSTIEHIDSGEEMTEDSALPSKSADRNRGKCYVLLKRYAIYRKNSIIISQ